MTEGKNREKGMEKRNEEREKEKWRQGKNTTLASKHPLSRKLSLHLKTFSFDQMYKEEHCTSCIQHVHVLHA